MLWYSSSVLVPRASTNRENNLFFQVAKLLDQKRSQAIGIFVSSLHLSAQDIESGQSYCDKFSFCTILLYSRTCLERPHYWP